jgi:hypothetical protein
MDATSRDFVRGWSVGSSDAMASLVKYQNG